MLLNPETALVRPAKENHFSLRFRVDVKRSIVHDWLLYLGIDTPFQLTTVPVKGPSCDVVMYPWILTTGNLHRNMSVAVFLDEKVIYHGKNAPCSHT